MQNDMEIRKLFKKLRVEDEKDTPPVEEILHPRNRRSKAGGIHLFRFKLAAGLLVSLLATAPLVLHILTRTSEPEQVAEYEFLEWESPTDFLLVIPETSMLSSALSYDQVLQNWETISEVQLNGE